MLYYVVKLLTQTNSLSKFRVARNMPYVAICNELANKSNMLSDVRVAWKMPRRHSFYKRIAKVSVEQALSGIGHVSCNDVYKKQ